MRTPLKRKPTELELMVLGRVVAKLNPWPRAGTGSRIYSGALGRLMRLGLVKYEHDSDPSYPTHYEPTAEGIAFVREVRSR